MLNKITFRFIIKAILAGIFVGLTGFEFLLVKQFDFKLNQVVASFIFPFGNTLIMALSLLLVTGQFPNLFNRQMKTNLFNLFIMFLFNVLGILIVSLIFLLLKKTNIEIFNRMTNVAKLKFPAFGFIHILKTFGKGILCGCFIYIGIFLYRLFSKPILEVLGMWIPVFIYVVLGFNNGLTDIFYLLANCHYDPLYLFYILAAFLGNLCGVTLLKILENNTIRRKIKH